MTPPVAVLVADLTRVPVAADLASVSSPATLVGSAAAFLATADRIGPVLARDRGAGRLDGVGTARLDGVAPVAAAGLAATGSFLGRGAAVLAVSPVVIADSPLTAAACDSELPLVLVVVGPLAVRAEAAGRALPATGRLLGALIGRLLVLTEGPAVDAVLLSEGCGLLVIVEFRRLVTGARCPTAAAARLFRLALSGSLAAALGETGAAGGWRPVAGADRGAAATILILAVALCRVPLLAGRVAAAAPPVGGGLAGLGVAATLLTDSFFS